LGVSDKPPRPGLPVVRRPVPIHGWQVNLTISF
jgi:hypothetical protein